MTYTWKDKYKGWYFIKERSDGYKRQQQRFSNVEKRTLDKMTDNSECQSDIKETSGRRNHFTRRNMMKWN